MSGIKRDSGKPDLSLVSRELMVLLARVREFGSQKYERNNWKKGFKVTRSIAASLRHIFAFLDGETLDPESGLSHLGHAIASLEHAVYDMEHRPENDDRDVPIATKEEPTADKDVYDILNTKLEAKGGTDSSIVALYDEHVVSPPNKRLHRITSLKTVDKKIRFAV